MDEACSFSVALWSRDDLYGLVLNGNRGKGVTLNGSLGIIMDIEFIENSVLVISGENGELRLDLHPETLSNKLSKVRA